MAADLATKRRSKLLAVAPEIVQPRKPKILIFGPAGVGKTWASLDWPSVYYIDTESGADLRHYREKLKVAGGMYFGPDQGSLDMEAVIGQVQALATEKHPYKTVVFDSITQVFNDEVSEVSERITASGVKDEFGASQKPVVRQLVRLLRWVNRADMNAVFIAHEKDKWGKNDKGQREVVGSTYDGWAKLEYHFHLLLRISKIGTGLNARRFAHIGKSRLESFIEGDRFDWSYADFAARYGRDVIEEEVKPVSIATPEQVAEISRLLGIVKVPPDWEDKCLTKAKVDGWEEMDEDKIAKVIESLQAKLVATNGDVL